MIEANECYIVEKEVFKRNSCRTNDMDDTGKNVLHINITVSENDVVKGARSILEVIRPVWDLEDVQFKVNSFLYCLFIRGFYYIF